MNNLNILFYSARQPMWVFNIADLRIVEVNTAAVTHYGYTKEEFLSKTIKDLYPEDIAADLIYELLAGNINGREFVQYDKAGKPYDVEITSHRITFNGDDACLVVVLHIKEKKEMLEKLAVMQTRLDKILESTSVGFFQTDNNAIITYWNNAAENMIGYNREYVLGKNLWEVFTEAKNSDFYFHFQEAVKQRVNVEFTEYFWPVQKWFLVNAHPLADSLIVHFRDITANKLAEEKLLEKIEQLKEVSYLNSHYIRKPVASLLGLTNLINENLVSETEFKKLASQIQDCSVELDAIIRKINSRVNEDDLAAENADDGMEEFSITNLIKDLIKNQQGLQSTHKLILESESNLTCYGNKHSIAIAIKNLIKNAVKFSPDSTPVIIELKIIDQNLVVSVQDFGIGINRQLINKIFLSFTKKEIAKELGTGLTKVSEIARKHNGSVWVESKPGKGSVFSIRFPFSNIAEFKKSGKTDFSIYKNAGVEIDYNEEHEYLTADWKGFQSFHSVKTGCYKLLDCINKYRCHSILNDNTNVMGTWGDAVDWVAHEYFPVIEKAGVKYIAWIYSPSMFSRLSADLTIESIKGDIITKTFDNKTSGLDWLLEMHQHD